MAGDVKFDDKLELGKWGEQLEEDVKGVWTRYNKEYNITRFSGSQQAIYDLSRALEKDIKKYKLQHERGTAHFKKKSKATIDKLRELKALFGKQPDSVESSRSRYKDEPIALGILEQYQSKKDAERLISKVDIQLERVPKDDETEFATINEDLEFRFSELDNLKSAIDSGEEVVKGEKPEALNFEGYGTADAKDPGKPGKKWLGEMEGRLKAMWADFNKRRNYAMFSGSGQATIILSKELAKEIKSITYERKKGGIFFDAQLEDLIEINQNERNKEGIDDKKAAELNQGIDKVRKAQDQFKIG